MSAPLAAAAAPTRERSRSEPTHSMSSCSSSQWRTRTRKDPESSQWKTRVFDTASARVPRRYADACPHADLASGGAQRLELAAGVGEPDAIEDLVGQREVVLAEIGAVIEDR